MTAIVMGTNVIAGRLAERSSASRVMVCGALGGALACVALGLIGSSFAALVLAALLVAVLVAIIAAETVAGQRRRARGEPSPMEALR
jgi:predicted MFS family arabinose efflux permease